MRRLTLVCISVALHGAPTFTSTAQQLAGWSVDARPTLVIGDALDDTSQMFSVVVGATRLPNGTILIGDYAAWSLHLYGADGKRLRVFGRKGSGPGEFSYLAQTYRCGDSLVTWDIVGPKGSVFKLDGTFIRNFRFAGPADGLGQPYGRSACNRNGLFVHAGWVGRPTELTPAYRGIAPFWLSKTDSAIGVIIGRFPGSERHTSIVDGRLRGTGPLPFGKQTEVAMADSLIYIGTAERFEILVFDLGGKQLPSIVKPSAETPPALTKADTDAELEKRVASNAPDRRAGIEREWSTMPFPKSLPPYRTLRVDSEGVLWVEDYPRVQAPMTRWTLFGRGGNQIAEIRLPRDLEVYEIGRDYILGRYLDPEAGIPHVRMYRLTRGR
jgi:hypothetical protein